MSVTNYRKCLSIAGFDGSGGAGLQADLKTFSAWGCYGMTVITALPVQNTMGVRRCYELPLSSISDQLEAIFDDIQPDSIKIGMLFSGEIIELVSSFISHRAKNIPVVLDPVMYAKSGDILLKEDAIDALKYELIPLATIITPNRLEAARLVGKKEVTEKSEIMKSLVQYASGYILLKGGHDKNELCDDWLYCPVQKEVTVLHGERIPTKNTHGTGCTMSAAITSGLALGLDVEAACKKAKQYIHMAIKNGEKNSVGKGSGPVHHFYHLWPTINLITS
ncbi:MULTISPECIES: bifunctional hydroxymethylpyrimidine kinase/phosphomethylpyrimidine kinase [Candidatus Ichthyocystis]|uniref:hydroxymethylpyrimidine kinase n=1 Tax=Candidatus Ichthyocystis hellenicum TaxID=1561003 RepID=A0A0S4M645_9BURK|nr:MULTISPECIES: bifunctional hydroxymethylpyrimidine kinase/phosphomethylpyrimidine kinase [Ichthyocystis]CUT17725.1 Hydroxymethylpyrimidine/phosphomethylpyrimidine kinase [Candidatus Ichthyocystis hellenicum]